VRDDIPWILKDLYGARRSFLPFFFFGHFFASVLSTDLPPPLRFDPPRAFRDRC